jgi:ABC-type polysaccharide/polyol phosphate transport system ATPase subunit
MNVIEVSNVTKIFKLYQSPAQRLREIFFRKPCHSQFVALKDITFSALQGESIGIIGENGAGKSTLLKILARILKPTIGSISMKGRTSALLELGAGFNPELTGEENIYLNGYLMGLTKEEIDEKRHEIIEFSELDEFIKRPVKTYSSGMHVRLAFAIATTVDPDILIVDEALAVGDEHFQKKCIDRMMGFREAAKTIIFCSHNMYYIQELCRRTLWIHKGRIRAAGDTGKVVMEYMSYEREKTAALKERIENLSGDVDAVIGKPVMITDVKVSDKNGNEMETLKTLDPVTFSFKIRCPDTSIPGHLGFALIRNDEIMCFGTLTSFDGLPPVVFSGEREFQIRIPSLPLLAGMYSLLIIAADEFAMHSYDSYRTKNFMVASSRKEYGTTLIEHEWIL